MSQSCLNDLMLLYVLKDYTNDRKAAITEFLQVIQNVKKHLLFLYEYIL